MLSNLSIQLSPNEAKLLEDFFWWCVMTVFSEGLFQITDRLCWEANGQFAKF